MKRLFAFFFVLSAVAAFAQSITYNSFDFSTGQAVTTLREMTTAGTNDHNVATVLTEPGFPSWSRDGQTLSLSARDPQRPDKVSWDVYLMDGTTGAVRKMANFEDAADGLGFHTQTPVAKAFSPDGKALAATVYLNTSVVNGGITRVPHLLVFDTSGQEPPVDISTGNIQDGFNVGGNGIAWSTTGLLAWPGGVGSPIFYNGLTTGVVNGTGIFTLHPNVITPGVFQLTFPVVRDFDVPGYILRRMEVDYAPAFSPDGNTVAYVRAVRSLQSPPGAGTAFYPLVETSIRRININRSGDTEILHLAAGLWISQLSWSPDGTQLLFDLSPEQRVNNIPMSLPVPESVEIHTLQMSTLTPSRIHSAPAVWPAWRPGATAPPVTLPQLAMRVVPGSNNIELTWPSATAPFQLQSNPNLAGGAWNNVTTTPVVSGGVNKVTLSHSAPRMFFRLTGQ